MGFVGMAKLALSISRVMLRAGLVTVLMVSMSWVEACCQLHPCFIMFFSYFLLASR